MICISESAKQMNKWLLDLYSKPYMFNLEKELPSGIKIRSWAFIKSVLALVTSCKIIRINILSLWCLCLNLVSR